MFKFSFSESYGSISALDQMCNYFATSLYFVFSTLIIKYHRKESKEKVAIMSVFSVDDSGEYYHDLLDHNYSDGNEKALSWNEMLESCKPSSSSMANLPEKHVYKPAGNVSIAIIYFVC